MDACCSEKLQEQGIEIPENIIRYIPDWDFPNGTGHFAWHLSRPDAVFVRLIQRRSTHLGPKIIPAHKRDIHRGTQILP
eukprot:scaffold91000_cov17-Tisochrysis_lutea.AAC.1